LNLDLAYKTMKCHHSKDKWTYLYELPLHNYAVVQYGPDCETIEYSAFHFEWVEALHEYNKIKNNRDE